jgi:hypothetical protein
MSVRMWANWKEYGIWTAMKLNWCRMVLLLISMALAVVLFWVESILVFPLANKDIENKPTFLPVPPQYNLEEVPGQNLYATLIYGIMHGNLAVLCVIPLPTCYFAQNLLVKFVPVARYFVPTSPALLHRRLGYLLLGGLTTATVIWLIFMGHACFAGDTRVVETEELKHTPRTCLAFEPADQVGKDVYLLRFQVVWPLTFFFCH